MMDAGRALDALVAEKVMGIHVGPALKSIDIARLPRKEQAFEAHGIPACMVRHYSTDIAAAWTVLEKLLAMNLDDVRFTTIALAPATNGRWAAFAGCCEVDEEHEWFEQQPLLIADTAPLAICGAALRAVGYSP